MNTTFYFIIFYTLLLTLIVLATIITRSYYCYFCINSNKIYSWTDLDVISFCNNLKITYSYIDLDTTCKSFKKINLI